MFRNSSLMLISLVIIILLAACMSGTSLPSQTEIAPTAEAGLPNPASVFCIENGGQLDLRTDAEGGVAGVCMFPDGSECDEWAYFHGECAPGGHNIQPVEPTEDTSAPVEIPESYAGWNAYQNTLYGFSLLIPPDWVVEEVGAEDPLLGGHLLNIYPLDNPQNLNLRVTFRQVGDEVLLWPTGVGEGEFVLQGTLDVAGAPVLRMQFVCPGGEINALYYHQSENEANIQRGNLEFGFLLDFTGVHCQEGYSIDESMANTAEMIIASLVVP